MRTHPVTAGATGGGQGTAAGTDSAQAGVTTGGRSDCGARAVYL